VTDVVFYLRVEYIFTYSWDAATRIQITYSAGLTLYTPWIYTYSRLRARVRVRVRVGLALTLTLTLTLTLLY